MSSSEALTLDGRAFNVQQEAIARIVGSRPDDCKGLSRVMRLPPFLHQKGEPFEPRVLSTTGQRYTLAQIQEAFPLPVSPARPVASNFIATGGIDRPTTPVMVRRKYALNIAQNLADELAQVGEGQRNTRLNAAAFKLGQLIGGGYLDREEGEALLSQAARAAGLSDREICDTLTRALADGMAQPDPLNRVGQLAQTRRHGSQRGGADSGLPEIVVNERHFREIAADAEAALLAANEPPTLFQRGGSLVRLSEEEEGVHLRPLDAVALKGILARTADFIRLTERTEKGENGKKEVVTDSSPARPPADLAPDLLARTEHLCLPKLRTLAKSPIYAPDGQLVSTEGYHAPSGIYLALRGLIIPRLPTVQDALTLLRELLSDFPFSPPDAGFAHTLSALLLPLVRPMINGPTPIHLIEASTRGSGKGLLSDVITHVTVGGPAGVMVQPKDGDEFEKRVTSILLEGAPVVLLDNVSSLKGDVLAAALTSSVWRGRRLGKSEMLTLPNGALWLATGNNVNLDDDMPRRIVPIRLDPGVERPEERTGFRHPDLLAYILAHRPALVAACLALIEVWKRKGCPKGKARLGSFESWAAIIGGILEVAGVPGFLTAREELYETANAEPQEWAALLSALYGAHGSESIGARDVLAAMRGLGLCSDHWENRQNSSALKRVGRAVIQRRDRVFGGHRFRLAGKTATGNAAYCVEPLEQDQKKTPETPKTQKGSEEAPSRTIFTKGNLPKQTPGVSSVFGAATRETPEKHWTRKGVPDEMQSVSGVSGVSPTLNLSDEDAVEV